MPQTKKQEHERKCPVCNGHGWTNARSYQMPGGIGCAWCKGTGKINYPTVDFNRGREPERCASSELDAAPGWMSVLSEEEKRAVLKLSAKQELTPLQVLRCALRDYQARVMGMPDLGVGGCMGDD